MTTPENTMSGAGISAALYSAMSRLATWDGSNGPCFCLACDSKFGPDKHRHSQECEQARMAMAEATGQVDMFIIARRPWNYSRENLVPCPADSVAMDWQNDLESFPCMD